MSTGRAAEDPSGRLGTPGRACLNRIGVARSGLRKPSSGLRAMLRRRGLSHFRLIGRKNLLLPRGRSALQLEAYYQRLKQYSFRLVLRGVLTHPRATLDRLTQFCSTAKVETHRVLLSEMNLVEPHDEDYHLVAASVRSFGDALEWFVAALLEDKFQAEVLWGGAASRIARPGAITTWRRTSNTNESRPRSSRLCPNTSISGMWRHFSSRSWMWRPTPIRGGAPGPLRGSEPKEVPGGAVAR